MNQWAGQAYINLGLKLSDKVAEMYSGLGVSALANAAGVLSSNVSQIGNDVVSNSQSITQLRNALTQTDANVASKADQTAMNSPNRTSGEDGVRSDGGEQQHYVAQQLSEPAIQTRR